MKKFSAAAIFQAGILLAVSAASFAQLPAPKPSRSAAGSRITGTEMEALPGETLFKGKVDFTQGNFRIQADRMRSRETGAQDQSRIEASGRVVITRKLDDGAQVVMTADKAVYRTSDGWGELIGSPKVRRIFPSDPKGDAILLSDSLEWFEDGARIHAKGGVRMARPGEALTCDEAWYHQAADELHAQGRAHWIRETAQGSVVADGEAARVEFKTGRAQMLGRAHARLFTP